MKEISRLKAQAKRALERVEGGKKFTSSYVLNRMEKAAQLNPKDILICNMRDVVRKYSSSNKFITQRKFAEFYNSLYGLSGGRTNFRQNLGDLLPDSSNVYSGTVKDASNSRINYENELLPIFSENKMSKEFAGLFSLDSKQSIPLYGDTTVKKAEKFTKVQLVSMGYSPTSVSAVKTNEHFILCNASFDMPNHSQVSVAVPVQVSNGIPSLPKHFIQGDSLVSMSQDNLFIHMKELQGSRSKSNHSKFASERPTDSISSGRAVVPASLSKYADLENDLVAAASNFSVNQVKMASGVVASEFAAIGVSNPQVKVSHSDDKTIVLNVSIPTSMGRKGVLVPVDMPNGSPVIPSKFSSDDNFYPISREGLGRYLKSGRVSLDSTLSRQSDEMARNSYQELLSKIISGVSTGNYRLAEDALSTIGDRFDGSQYLSALDKFTKLLKHSSEGSERDGMIKNALRNGDLISVPTSVEPYCPKLGLPASKITFDEKGRIIPIRRASQSDILEAGAMISSSKVVLS